MTDRRAVVAVDVGGTTIKAGLISPGELHILERIPTGRERGYEAALDDVVTIVASLGDRAAALGLDVVATGVVVPGVVDEARGVGVMSVAFGWRDLELGDLLGAQISTAVSLRHDVRSAARAEAVFGAAAGSSVALFVAIGTGIAAAVVVGDRVLHGAAHQAGELGQLLVTDPGGSVGDPGDALVTLETVASARGIGERYRSVTDRDALSVDAAHVVEAAGRGDVVAARIWQNAVDALAQALVAAVVTVDPEVIVLGGGLSGAGTNLVEPLRIAMASRLPWRPVPRLEIAGFGEDAGIVGAALDAWAIADDTDVAALAAGLDPVSWRAQRSRQGWGSLGATGRPGSDVHPDHEPT